MKHAYLVRLHTAKCTYYMPYIFTSYKEAILYGEYKYRICEDIEKYEIKKFETLKSTFYKLK